MQSLPAQRSRVTSWGPSGEVSSTRVSVADVFLNVQAVRSAAPSVMVTRRLARSTDSPVVQVMEVRGQSASGDCVTVYVPLLRPSDVTERGRPGSVSSSNAKVAHPVPRQPVNPKSWASSGTLSWVMVMAGAWFLNVQVTYSLAARVTVTRRAATSTFSLDEHEMADRGRGAPAAWVIT